MIKNTSLLAVIFAFRLIKHALTEVNIDFCFKRAFILHILHVFLLDMLLTFNITCFFVDDMVQLLSLFVISHFYLVRILKSLHFLIYAGFHSINKL